MKTDALTLKQGTRGRPQLLEPPGADPHAGWCGRGEAARPPPIPIFRRKISSGLQLREEIELGQVVEDDEGEEGQQTDKGDLVDALLELLIHVAAHDSLNDQE
jgi:hypothetical protein